MIFHIEYSNHSLLTVRLLACNLFANVYVYDFLSYQTGMLMCSSVNASIELSGVNGLACLDLKDNKIISFKCSTYFKAKDPTLETLLRLMDNLVIAYRVYEPELQMTSNVISVRDAVRLRTVDRKIQHYSNMLLKYSRKVYK